MSYPEIMDTSDPFIIALDNYYEDWAHRMMELNKADKLHFRFHSQDQRKDAFHNDLFLEYGIEIRIEIESRKVGYVVKLTDLEKATMFKLKWG